MKTLALLIAVFCSLVITAQTGYKTEEIIIWNDSIKLPGTLSYKENSEKQPLVIFVQGSGNPDRNGNQPQFNVNPNYIKQLAHELSSNGIAFFRYDKRNVPKENHPFILKKYHFTDLIDDVVAILNHFENDSRFNNVILIGHSQGSLVAMLAINKQQNKVSKFISLAGLGESADKAIIRQLSAQNKELGEIAAQHLQELSETGAIKDVNFYLLSIFAKQNLPFLKQYISYNPVEEIKKITIPILIINGDQDTQVTVNDAKNLHEAAHNSKLVIIKNMNHVLKEVTSAEQNTQSYLTDSFPVSKELIKAITSFVKQ